MSTRGPGGQRSERAWNAILEATRDELATRGYDRLSIDRIAAAAGVGKQTVYRWYPSKNALVAECVLRGHVIPLSIVVLDTGDCRADIASWIGDFAAESRKPSAAALTRAGIAAAAEDPEIAARYAEVTQSAEAALIGRLDLGAVAGQLPVGAAPATIAEMILGSLLYRMLAREEITPQFSEQLLGVIFGLQAARPEA